VESPTDWEHGRGIHSATDPANPFRETYNIVTVPYCTGDAFIGDNDAVYKKDENSGITIRHRGYRNLELSLEKAHAIMPVPEKAVLLGCSAGGIGAIFHLKNLRKIFSDSERFVISDAGVPFKPPYIDSQSYEMLIRNWRADVTMVHGLPPGNTPKHFGDVVKFNTEFFPDTRFGFISSYRDSVMTFFAITLGSPFGLAAVKSNIIDIASNFIGSSAPNSKVFFLDSSVHCHTPKPLKQQVSLKQNLGQWISAMLNGETGWHNVRPDLAYPIRSATFAKPPHGLP
jgi:hypothetical protein